MIKNILDNSTLSNFFNGSVEDIIQRWSEPHRHYHNLNHLYKMIDLIKLNKDKVTRLEYDMLMIAAIYHDIVYLPREDSINIKESIYKFESDFKNLPYIFKKKISEIIDSTNSHDFENSDKLIGMFNSYDMNGILNGTLEELIEDGENVEKEYNIDTKTFNFNRIKFLEKYKKYNTNIQKCIDYLKKL